MSFRCGVPNLLVLTIILLIIPKTYRAWTKTINVTIGKEAAEKPVTKIEIPQIPREKKEPSINSSNPIISEKNIFSPERKDFPAQPGPGGKKFVARPQIILYGITIAGDYQSYSVFTCIFKKVKIGRT
jgi:hypothetical protein